MHRVALCSLLLVAAASCDREPRAPAAGESQTASPSDTASSRPAPSPKDAPPPPEALDDELPETIETVSMPAGEPVALIASDAKKRELIVAPPTEQVCLEKVFDPQNRVMARTATNCRPAPDATYRLYDMSGEELSSFQRYESYSEPLATVLAQIDGELSFISLKDGAVTRAPRPSGDERFVFVQNRPEVMVFGHPEAARDKFGFAIVEGVPTQPVATNRIEPRVPDTGSLAFDAKRNLYVYRDIQTDCFRAALTPDGTSPAFCEARILRGRLTGKRPLWTDHWLVLADPKGADNVAINIYTKRELDPTKGLCDEPATLAVDPDLGVPRMLVGCPPDEGKGMALHLWTPNKTFDVPGGPYMPGEAHGDYVALTRGDEDVWLDVRNVALVNPNGLSLATTGVATRATADQHDVFAIEAGTARSLGAVTCGGTLEVTAPSSDVIVGICGTAGTPVDEDGCLSKRSGLRVEKSFVWDLKAGALHTTDEPVVAVTDDSILTAASPFVQDGRVCRTQRLSRIDR